MPHEPHEPHERRRPVGLYVHFPFCAARCHYCAFYFVVGRRDVRARYLAAVRREIAGMAADPRFAGRPVHSLYFGGGTPSLMDGADVAALTAAAREAFAFEPDAEVSLEANPDGLGAAALDAWRAAGVNRLTLGWQSLRADGLRTLTRTHTVEENAAALTATRAAGFDNVGVDLIFGRPGQTPADWAAELDEAAAMGPEHVSAYELTFEEGTRLTRRRAAGTFVPPDEDARADMFEATEDVLARHGVRRYEISNFACPGRECRHNLASWQGGDLLGVGASAASHVRNARWTNVPDLDAYVRRVEAGEGAAEPAEVLDDATWAAEDLYLGLRTAAGVDVEARLAGVRGAGRLRGAIADARRDDRVELGGDGRCRLTPRGRLLADSVFESLLAP